MPQASDDVITFELDGDVAVVGFDDGKVNALTPTSLAALEVAVDRAADEAHALVIAGRPGVFTAGFDLAVMTGDDVAAVQDLVRSGVELTLKLHMHPHPVIAACTGHAIAMGAIVLMAVDSRFGTEGEFRIGTNEVAIGMPVPRFALTLARDRLSRRHLNQATLQARMYDPAGAVDAGYLDSLHPSAEVVRAAVTHAQHLVDTLHRGAFRKTRELLRAGVAEQVRTVLDLDIAEIGTVRHD